MQVTYPTLTTGNLQAGSGVKLFGPTPVNQNFADLVDFLNTYFTDSNNDGVADTFTIENLIVSETAEIPLTDTYVGYGDSDGHLTGDANFTWDSTNKQLKLSDGTVSLPAYSFVDDANTGIYRIGADNIGIACGGLPMFDVSTARVQIYSETGDNVPLLKIFKNTYLSDCAMLFDLDGSQQWAMGIDYSHPDAPFKIATGIDLSGNSYLIIQKDYGNISLGHNAGASLENGSKQNTAIGYNALTDETTGDYNVAIGYQPLSNITGGISNIGIGFSAGAFKRSGSENIYIGLNCGYGDDYGSYNVMIGPHAGADTALSNYNYQQCVYIGYYAGSKTAGADRQVCIGPYAGRFDTDDDVLYIDNRSRTNQATAKISALIYGEFNSTPSSQIFRVNGQIQASDGSAGVPSVSFSGDPDNGLYRIDANNFGFATNGTLAGQIDSSQRWGIGVPSGTAPSSLLEVYSSTANPVLTITGAHATDYDPQIQFRTDAAPTVKWSMGVDGTDDHFNITNTTGVGGTPLFGIDYASGGIGISTTPSKHFAITIDKDFTDVSASKWGLYCQVDWTPSGAATNKDFYGLNFYAYKKGANSIRTIFVNDSVARLNSSGNVANVYGTASRVYSDSFTGAVTGAVSFFYADTLSIAGQITANGNVYGLYCDDPTTALNIGGTSYGVYVNTAWDVGACYAGDSLPVLWGAGEDAKIEYDGTDLLVTPNAVGSGTVKIENALRIKEIAAAEADQAGYGQLWCKDNAGTTELWFTDDSGTDTKIV